MVTFSAFILEDPLWRKLQCFGCKPSGRWYELASGERVFNKMRSSFLPSVAEQLFKDLKKIYQETSQIPDDMLIALKFVFGSCALQALDMVDQRSVTCVSSPSGRRAFQVTGGSGRMYTCLVSCHFCPCPAFAYTVLRRNEGLLCKHILAVYLSQAMGLTQQDTVSDQEMTTLLSGTAM